MRCSITLWQFAKKAQITFGAVAKGNRSAFWSICMRNLRIACNTDHFSNIPLGELNSEKNKMEASLKFCLHLRFLYTWRLIQLYHFQANLIWCDGTLKTCWIFSVKFMCCKEEICQRIHEKNMGKADQCKNPRNWFISLSKSEVYGYRRNKGKSS